MLPIRLFLQPCPQQLGYQQLLLLLSLFLLGAWGFIRFPFNRFFGSAATYTEVNLCIQYRKKFEDGAIMGGPMQYLKHLLSPSVANWYAIGCFILMAAWSSAQANQLAAILNSPLLESYRIPTAISGASIAALVIFALLGGIKRISSLSSKLIPTMFVLYVGSCFWIILYHVDKLWEIMQLIFQSALSPYALANGVIVGGVVSSLRWGIFKGIQTCEAGVERKRFLIQWLKQKTPSHKGHLQCFQHTLRVSSPLYQELSLS